MTTAIYAGSFDPITLGHLSVIHKAVRVFSHVRVLIAHNPEKHYMFDWGQRMALTKAETEHFPNVSVDKTEAFVVDYARDIGASFLVRGIRSATDTKSELELAQVNSKIAPEIVTIFFAADLELSSVSSSELKRKIEAKEDVRTYCSSRVENWIKGRVQGDRLK